MPTPLLQELTVHEYLRSKVLEQYPDTDEETLADTLEGLTDLHDKLAAVVRSLQEDVAFSKALRGRMSEMGERLKRFELRAGSKRELVSVVMERAEIKKIVEPEFTVSLRQSPRPLVVSDEGDIPEEYWNPQPPKLDRRRLTDDLKLGATVPGACLGNGGQSLAVRIR